MTVEHLNTSTPGPGADEDNIVTSAGYQQQCALCRSWQRIGLQAWNLWDPGETSAVARGQHPGGSWTEEIAALLADDSEDFPRPSAQEIAEHFYRHQPVQPAPRKGVARGQAIYGLQALGDHLEDVVTAVFRLHKMTTEQIATAFYPNKSVYQVDELLSYAAQAHYLYRDFVSNHELKKRTGLVDVLGKRLTKKSTVWYLGRAGAVYVQEKLGLDYQVSYTRDRQNTASTTLAHDLKAARVGVTLAQALRQVDPPPATDSTPRVAFNHKNWLGPTTQGLIMGYWHRPEIRWAQIMPDGMLGIDVQQSAYGSGGTVLFLEYDHGSKEHREIVDQLLAYNALAESGAVAARFPQLVDWSVPMLMVFSSRQRMESIVSKFREAITEVRPYTPLWFVAEEDWLADPLAAIVGNFWAPGGKEKLIPSWLAVSEPIISRLGQQQLLEINQRGAPVRNEKGQKYNSAIHNQNIIESATNNPAPNDPSDSPPGQQQNNNVQQSNNAQQSNDSQHSDQDAVNSAQRPEQQAGGNNNQREDPPAADPGAGMSDSQSTESDNTPQPSDGDKQQKDDNSAADPEEHRQQKAKAKEERKKQRKKALVKPAPQVAAAQRWSQQLVAAYQHLADLQAEGEKMLAPLTPEDLPPVAGDLQPSAADPGSQQPMSESPAPEQSTVKGSAQPLPGETELPPPVTEQTPPVAPQQQPAAPVATGGPAITSEPFPPLAANAATPAEQPPDQPIPSVDSDFPELTNKKTPKQPPLNAQSRPEVSVAPPSTPENADQHPGAAPQAAPGEDIEELLSRQADQARRQQ